MTYDSHDQARGDIDRHALQRVLDHQPGPDLVHGERLERVLQRAQPLQPAKHGRDVVQVHEEARVRHLVQRGERGDEDRDAAVTEEACEQEVLGERRAATGMRVSICAAAEMWCDGRTKRVMASV